MYLYLFLKIYFWKVNLYFTFACLCLVSIISNENDICIFWKIKDFSIFDLIFSVLTCEFYPALFLINTMYMLTWAWMKDHHLQLNLAKTELFVLLAKPTLQHDHPARFINNYPIKFSQKSWGNFWWPADFQRAIAKTARSCRFALHNIRKIRPFLTEHAAQLLVQALVISRLDYCNALLAGLPSNTIKPLQMIQNAAARLVFNEPKRAHVTPLLISLHWLPVAARIKFKTLMLAYRTATGSAPSYFHSLMTIYIPSRSLRSASERRLVVPSQRGSKSLSRTFSFIVPGWWNELRTPSGILNPWQFSSNTWKLISSIINIYKPFLSLTLLFSLNSHRLTRICSEQCLEICIPSTSFVCLPLYNVSLIVFLNCRAPWINKCKCVFFLYGIYISG